MQNFDMPGDLDREIAARHDPPPEAVEALAEGEPWAPPLDLDRAADHIAWLLRQRRAAALDLARVHHQAETEREAVMAVVQPDLEQIEEWEADRSAGPGRALEWTDHTLTGWMRALREADPNAPATFRTPVGDIRSRARRPQITVVDADVAVTVLSDAHPDLVTVTRTVTVSSIAAGLKSGVLRVSADGTITTGDGEPIGATLTSRPPSVQIVQEGVDR